MRSPLLPEEDGSTSSNSTTAEWLSDQVTVLNDQAIERFRKFVERRRKGTWTWRDDVYPETPRVEIKGEEAADIIRACALSGFTLHEVSCMVLMSNDTVMIPCDILVEGPKIFNIMAEGKP